MAREGSIWSNSISNAFIYYICLVAVVVRGPVYIPQYDILLVLQILDKDKQAFPHSGVDVYIDFGGIKILTDVS